MGLGVYGKNSAANCNSTLSLLFIICITIKKHKIMNNIHTTTSDLLGVAQELDSNCCYK